MSSSEKYLLTCTWLEKASLKESNQLGLSAQAEFKPD